ncbi:MAG TPA: UPF0182 family protein [Micromonosporaceae bacterium]|jgi:hypothetical protein
MRGSLPRISRRGKVTLAVVGGIILLLIFLNQIVGLWTDWWWYQEVGYTNVFGGMVRTKIWLFLLFGLFLGGFLAGNLYLAFRLRPFTRGGSPEQQALERYRLFFAPRMGLWIGVLGGLVGFFGGLSGQSHWQQWMLFRNRVDFGIADPQFGTDIGFYVFDLPFWRYLIDVGFTATALAIIGSVAVHYLFGGVRLQGAGDRMTVGSRAHLTSLVALFVLLKATAYFLDRRSMLVGYNSGTGTWGAGYTDINAILPAKEVLAYISILVAIAILVFSNARMRNLVWAGAALALLGISAVAIGGAYPLFVQQVTVKPNTPTKEAPYILRSIDATRQAFGIADVKTEQFTTANETPPAALNTDTTVVPTIRLLDPALVRETYTQYQQIRSFYDFPEKLDIDRYTINGRLQDFVVAARELNPSLLDSSTNWQNRHTVYTHGYGFVAAPANTICDGAPYFVSGLLPNADNTAPTNKCQASTDTISVTQPRIYYGELSSPSDYVIVGKAPGGTDAEYDRPEGGGQANNSYDGTGGVPVSSMFRRLMYGLRFWEPNFLLYSGFNENSKILYIRDPVDRVKRVAPFLTLDSDPYPAVIDGRVVWILDGYTTSSSYPYSQEVDLQQATSDAQTDLGTTTQARRNVNYMRNSVKATVDAYDGTVTLYAFDETDPVLKAWNQAFGGTLIQPRSSIPPELAAHFRYPEDLFKVQRDLLSKFHVSNPQEFNNGADFWAVPDDPASTASTGTPGGKQPPYYLLTQFPGVTQSRFQLTAALTPNDRQNLSALVTGVVNADGLSLEMVEMPRTQVIQGPGQAQQLMVNDKEARSQITLLSGQGENAADVLYGNLLSLPYGGGLLYVQPVYIKSKGDKTFPQMKLVLVSYGSSNVAFGDSLSEAIKALVAKGQGQDTGGSTNPPPGETGSGQLSPEVQAALDAIDAALTRLQQAQAGNFADYGAALQALQDAIDQYRQAEAAANNPPQPSTPPPGS